MKHLLAHPLTRGLSIDDPRTTHLQRQLIREKPFLRQIYEEWYAGIVSALPPGEGQVLELGSGAGFLVDYIPNLITSEVLYCQRANAVLDGQQLPLASGSLRAIVMTDVLHHLPQPRRFFADAARCTRVGGVVVMIEPWVSTWSRLIFRHLHHEPFHPDAPEWEFASSGPLSGANSALPYLIFVRDRPQFEREFPMWRVRLIEPIMPFSYLVSGGVSMRSLTPGWSFAMWRWLEHALQPFMRHLGMFARIVLERVDPQVR